eukprot:CAMPEP_0173440170 /NCGR_PEP_ID=MMETSP1357-20121228/22350_1 /TAXON_ID=77926 /ORGANISM="Hemiselmis rufescens, Strain PCC563" /LENGTH=129 /DNA_ID=CAMNT_0014405629 /DNA_START=14 /DNA_END=400 /DNA_ORIENTATION=+
MGLSRFIRLLEMPEFSSAGYNTSTYEWNGPGYLYNDAPSGHRRDVYHNQYDEIEIPAHTWKPFVVTESVIPDNALDINHFNDVNPTLQSMQQQASCWGMPPIRVSGTSVAPIRVFAAGATGGGGSGTET